jgi:oligopeptide transport system substrate-binding protein
MARQLHSQIIVKMLFEGLTRVNKNSKPELALAAAIEISSDLKTYTFHLRPSQWTNGDPVTAEDFVYAWKKLLDPSYYSDMASQLYVIENAKQAKEGSVPLDEVGIRLLDEEKFQVTLNEPVPYFLEMISFPAFFPVNCKVDQENKHWAENAREYVGNGPFALQLWQHHDQLLVTKNPNYWDESQVQLDGVQFVMVKDDTAFLMYEKKELDWVGSPFSNLPVDLLKVLKQDNSLMAKEALATYFLRCNTGIAPFNHPKIRRAFALATERQEIVEHVTQGGQLPATGLVPVAMGLREAPYFQDGDVAGAQALLKEALIEMKLPKESLNNATLTYRSSERNHLIAQALQQQWFAAFGVRVKLEAVEGKVYFDRISRQDYQLIASDWFADYNDPINFLEVFKSKDRGSNNTRWENAEYARLLEESSRTSNQPLRRELLAKSEQILMQEMPIIPIFHYTLLYTSRPEIHNVVVSSLGGVDFKWASIDQKELGDIR